MNLSYHVCAVYCVSPGASTYFIYAPEGCPHGTHTTGTAYTRGTYSRVHTQTHTNT